MSPSPPVANLLNRLEKARRSGSGYIGCCPAHADNTPSLSITEAEDGRALICCQAGCTTEDVLGALKLTFGDLFPESSRPNGKPDDDRPKIVASYDYTDEEGNLLYQVVRMTPKAFRQRRPDGKGGWEWKLSGVRRVLYNLPTVIASVQNGLTVYVVEGEKDAEAMIRDCRVATCNPGGVRKWRPEYTEALRDARVVVVADRDEPGRAHAAEVAKALEGVAKNVVVMEPAEGKDAADHLAAGLSVDAFVRVEREQPGDGHQERPGGVSVPTLEPGMAVLDDVAAFLSRYVAFPSAAACWATALWVAHTHAIDAFESTPRLAPLSAEKRSGKTRLLEVLELLCPTTRHAVNMTGAALFRLVEAAQPTLLFDEADSYFSGKGKDNHEELRGLVNAGHRRGAVAYRCVGDPKNMKVAEFPAFCAVAIAGIGDLPDTIMDRSIVIRMRRRAPDELVEKFRIRKVSPVAQQLHDRVAAWAKAVLVDLAGAEPALPDGLDDRAEDCWEPLVAIGDAAGGDWPDHARASALELSTGKVDDETTGVRLLRDIAQVFTEDRISSAELASQLVALEEAPWGDWYGRQLDARGLARLLKRYGVRPKTVRIGDHTPRGYERSDFSDPWTRYLPDAPNSASEPQQPQHPCSEPLFGPQQTTSEEGLVAHTKQPVTCDVAVVAAEGAIQGNGHLNDGLGTCTRESCSCRTSHLDPSGERRCSSCCVAETGTHP